MTVGPRRAPALSILHRRWMSVVLCVLLAVAARAEERLVFGSFQSAQNASNWASRLSLRLNTDIGVERVDSDSGLMYRVVTGVLDELQAQAVRRSADADELRYWRLLDSVAAKASVVNPQEPVRDPPPSRPVESLRNPHREVSESRNDMVVQMLDFDLGVQSRTFFESGLDGQSRFHPSVSLQMDYYRSWDQERQSFTVAPFFRYDAQDSDRTHFDLREFFWTRVGDSWDLHMGVKQVFWGVTEFNHLIDIVNQTDLVDSIDGEEKLGQPMVHLSVVRNWGILDVHLLSGFRERTFAGEDGRLRRLIPVDNNGATYESGAEDSRIDGVVRWSHHIGPLEFGIYQFSGTSRDPQFELRQKPNGNYYLKPHYPVIDQTGLDLQAIVGEWAWKFEGISRSGFGDRYGAFSAGFERTLVGVLGGRTDLGLIAEYMYDERGDEAFNTVFENDLALGTRWQLNDVADSQALFGLIWDVQSNEYIVKLEASRRLGDTWTLLLDGRVFGGTDEPDPDDPLSSLDPDNKLGPLARDDYLQFEVTRYF